MFLATLSHSGSSSESLGALQLEANPGSQFCTNALVRGAVLPEGRPEEEQDTKGKLYVNSKL